MNKNVFSSTFKHKKEINFVAGQFERRNLMLLTHDFVFGIIHAQCVGESFESGM